MFKNTHATIKNIRRSWYHHPNIPTDPLYIIKVFIGLCEKNFPSTHFFAVYQNEDVTKWIFSESLSESSFKNRTLPSTLPKKFTHWVKPTSSSYIPLLHHMPQLKEFMGYESEVMAFPLKLSATGSVWIFMTYTFQEIPSPKRIKQIERLLGSLKTTLHRSTQEKQFLLEQQELQFSQVIHQMKAPLKTARGFLTHLHSHADYSLLGTTGIEEEKLKLTAITYLKDQEMFFDQYIQMLKSKWAEKTWFLWEDFIHQVELTFRVSFLRKNLRLNLHNTPKVDVNSNREISEKNFEVYGHPIAIFQVFENLLHNALQVLDPHNEVIIHYEITPSKSGKGPFLKIQVLDTGPGLPLEIQQNFQKPYHNRQNTAGNGLGLYICHKILELHKCILFYDPPNSLGLSHFTFSLPLRIKSVP